MPNNRFFSLGKKQTNKQNQQVYQALLSVYMFSLYKWLSTKKSALISLSKQWVTACP